MLTKCPFPYCQYPNCPPTAKIRSCGRSAEDLLEEVVKERTELLDTLRHTARNLKHILNLYQGIAWGGPDFDACPFGCTDCINNPQYQKETNYEEWAADGYPMTCWYVENGYISAETGCNRYDDEDK